MDSAQEDLQNAIDLLSKAQLKRLLIDACLRHSDLVQTVRGEGTLVSFSVVVFRGLYCKIVTYLKVLDSVVRKFRGYLSSFFSPRQLPTFVFCSHNTSPT